MNANGKPQSAFDRMKALQFVAMFATAYMLVFPTASAAEPLNATATIAFKGTSTLHDFHGQVSSQSFPLTIAAPDSNGNQTWSAEAEVVVGEMNTKHKGRDENMHRMFGKDQFPRIKASITNAALPSVTNAVETKITLRIRDKDQPITVRITNWKADGNGLSFRATFGVSLKAFGLTAPSVIGLIRVGDRVEVVADVIARPEAPPEPSSHASNLSPSPTQP